MPDLDAPFYVTTPIYYVNDRPHLGHVYTTMIADVVARHHRSRGRSTFFLTGVDEHAAKVVETAAARGLEPQAWADHNAAAFRETFEGLGLSHDDFVRTSDERHTTRVTAYIQALLESGDVYAGVYEGWYDAGQEEYVPDGTAQACEFLSAVNEKPLVRKQEQNYFFRLSAYRERLLEHFARCEEAGTPFVRPRARRNEILNRIKEAEDVPISRTGTGGWGIPVPGDPEQTVYVWIDALFNYLTYTDDEERRAFWVSGATHLIAKDILWFHAAIWPALLMALGQNEQYAWVSLPRQVYAHSYWISDSGQKMSKSLGNFLDPEALKRYAELLGHDALRYFLATRGPLGAADAAFGAQTLADVYNADLANTYGNACSRVTNMITRFAGGQVPECGAPDEASEDLKAAAIAVPEGVLRAFNELELGRAADAALGLVRQVDAYLETTAPFRLAKEAGTEARVGTILHHAAEALRIASLLLHPLLPNATTAFLGRIGCAAAAPDPAAGSRGDLERWLAWGGLRPGSPVEKGTPLFPRLDPSQVGEWEA